MTDQELTNPSIIAELVTNHPLTTFEEENFLNLLEHSLSLNVFEKKRVIDAIPTLSQFQIDELVKVFEDEREEFKKLMATEAEAIKDLVTKSREWWKQLEELYVQERKQNEKASEDQAKIDELKNSLWL